MPSSTADWAVIIEWTDGTVSVNGPYSEQEYAIIAAQSIGRDLAKDDDRQVVDIEDGCKIGPVDIEVGAWDEWIDLYAREMGTPIEPGE